MKCTRPRPADRLAAGNRRIADVIAPGLHVLFCGINPSLYSAAVGHHFARPGNRFWPTLHAAGFTDHRLTPAEQSELLPLGYGITNVVARATATASELSDEEMITGGRRLAARVRRYRPLFLAVLGVGAYRVAWRRPKAMPGAQDERIGATRIWVLPNPSGLNAHYRLKDLAGLYRELRLAVEELRRK